jgi:hypothetical protein
MNRKIQVAENLINKGCQTLGVTPGGKRWLELAVDPFKDLPIPPEGYPDQVMAPSCVQIVRQKYSVSTSSGTSMWDCNIFTDVVPVQFAHTETAYVASQFQRVGQTGTAYRGGVVVRKGTTGSDLTNADAAAASLGLPVEYFENTDTRVIAHGFEVHNVTNELNVSGSVTAWRNPRAKEEVTRVATLCEDLSGDVAFISTSLPWIDMDEPPETVSEATLLPGSETWEAKYGAYIVPVMSNPNNLPSPLINYYQSTHDDDGTVWALPITSVGTQKLQRGPLAANIITPFTQQGAYFTGLTPETVLIVDAIYVVERFADDQQSDLATLSRPSTPYDAAALKLYSEIAREMPPGVRVDNNGFGDWVSGIAQVVSRVAKAASFIPGPLGLIASGVGAVADVITGREQLLEEERPRPRIENVIVEQRPGNNTQPVAFELVKPNVNNVNTSQPVLRETKIVKIEKPKNKKKQKKQKQLAPYLYQPLPRRGMRMNTRARMFSPRNNSSVQYSTFRNYNTRRYR